MHWLQMFQHVKYVNTFVCATYLCKIYPFLAGGHRLRLNTSALTSNLDLYPWVFYILKLLPRSSWVCTHEYHILMGYLISTHKCKETCEYSQVFSRELIEIIQLSINNIIHEYLMVAKVINFVFKSWHITDIDSNPYTCTSTHDICQNQYLDP